MGELVRDSGSHSLEVQNLVLRWHCCVLEVDLHTVRLRGFMFSALKYISQVREHGNETTS